MNSASYRGYGDNSFGQWYWWAPRQSWIYRADFVNVDFTPTYQSYPRAKCLAMGTYSSTYYDWERGSMSIATDQYGGSRPAGQTPWIGGGPPDGSCNTQVDNSRTHVPYSPTPGNLAVYRLFSYGGGVPTNMSWTAMDGAAIHLDDGQAPTVSSAATNPGGWVRSAQITTSVSARDAAPGTPAERGGLGMFVDQLLIPTQGGATVPQNTFAACHLRLTRCPEAWSFGHGYSTEDADPGTAGNQPMPEGTNAIYGDVYDATGKRTRYQAGTVKIDRSGPTPGIEGFDSRQLLRGRNYTITGTASDSLSGPKSITIKLDGQEKASRSDCLPTDDPCRLGWTLDAADPGLTEGEHTIAVTTTDQVGNTTTTYRSFLIDRTKPSYEVDGSLLPTDTGWVASGEQDLIIDAGDEPGTAPNTTGGVGDEAATVPATGATHIEARIDGNPIEPPVDQPCEAGGCELGAELVANTDTLAEGPHTLTVVVRDGAGNTADGDPIPFKLERTPPSLTLEGTLEAAKDTMLTQGSTYALTADATDASGPAPQSGLGRISVAIDDDAPDAVEQPCPFGACPQSRTYTFASDDYEPGPHTVTVTATDLAGNETTQPFTVNNPEPPPPSCTSSPQPTVVTSTAPLLREIALETFRLRLPEAFRESLPTLDADLGLRPLLQFDDPDLCQAAGSLNLGTIDRQAADGATIRFETDSEPICMSPGQVSDSASQPKTPIAGTTALFANAAPATDLAIRPTVTGAKTFTQIRELTAPTDFVWNLALQPGQQLQKLPDGTVVVVEPLPGAEPSEPDPSLAPPPDIAAQRAAIADPARQAQFASDAFQRVLEATPDEIVAIIPKPWAIDALDRPVATSLEVSGSQQITMRVQHGVLTPYPVIADPEVIMADSVDEFEVRKADANTAEYTDAEAETFEPAQPPGFVYPDPPAQDPNYTDDELDENPLEEPPDDEGEGFSEVDGDVEMAEANAAARRASLPSIGLTESPPALFYSPDRRELSPAHYRPVVPWDIMRTINHPNRSTGRERFRAKLWTDWVRLTEPGGLRGNESDAEQQRGIASDVAIQAVEGTRGPRSVREYERWVGAFIRKYAPRIRHLAAWNEPNRNDSGERNPTYRSPGRAGRYWNKAEQICHPSGAPRRCGFVIAGEFVGNSGRDDRFKKRGKTINYQERYRDFLLGRQERGVPRKRKNAPRVWGFHAYADMSRYALNRKAKRAPISEHYYRKFRSKRYERPGGQPPAVWLTAVGSYYRRPCDKVPRKYRDDLCPPRLRRPRLIVGKVRQRNGLRKLLGRLTSRAFVRKVGGPGVTRLLLQASEREGCVLLSRRAGRDKRARPEQGWMLPPQGLEPRGISGRPHRGRAEAG